MTSHEPLDGVPELLRVLDLEPTGPDTYRGLSQRMPHNRVFGGQVLAQSLMAAGATMRDVEESHGPRPAHSLHAYFLRPGDDTLPIDFVVERLRDGSSFSARRVLAMQHDQPILSLSASFQAPAEGLEHMDTAPRVPGPDGLPSLADRLAAEDSPRAHHVATRPIEQRHVEGTMWEAAPTEPGSGDREQHVWMRATSTLPDDPLLHAAVLAYASDYALLEPVLRHHGVRWDDPSLRIASLDHAMWFHRPVRMDDWVLYQQRTPSGQGGRALALGSVYGPDGALAASVAQEGMVRIKR